MPFITQKQFAAYQAQTEGRLAYLEEYVRETEREDWPSEGQEATALVEMGALYGEDVAELLVGAGYVTPEQVRGADDDQLLAIDQIGPGRLKKIRAAKTEGGE